MGSAGMLLNIRLSIVTRFLTQFKNFFKILNGVHFHDLQTVDVVAFMRVFPQLEIDIAVV